MPATTKRSRSRRSAASICRCSPRAARGPAEDLQLDEALRREVLLARGALLLDELRRDAVDAEVGELARREVVAEALVLVDFRGGDAADLQVDRLPRRERREARALQ